MDEGPGRNHPTGNRQNAGFSGAEFAGIGLQFALVILVFTGIGYWLDKRLGSSPWLLLLFVFAGAAAGFYSMVRKAKDAGRAASRNADGRARGGSGGKRG